MNFLVVFVHSIVLTALIELFVVLVWPSTRSRCALGIYWGSALAVYLLWGACPIFTAYLALRDVGDDSLDWGLDYGCPTLIIPSVLSSSANGFSPVPPLAGLDFLPSML